MAMYSPTLLSFNGVSIDASVNNTFTWTTNVTSPDSQTDYQLKIYLNSNNTLIYDSTKITSTNEYHTVPSGTLTNGQIYKYQVTTWSGANSSPSQWILFFTEAQATFTVGSLPSSVQVATISATYNQAQDIPLKTYRVYLYLSTDLENPIVDSGDIYPDTLIYDGDVVEYEFDGLESGFSYAVQFTGFTQNDDFIDSGKSGFSIVYSYPPDVPQLEVTQLSEYGNIKLNWAALIQILGFVNGTYSYTTGKFGQGIQLDSGSELYYTETIPIGNTTYFWVKLPIGFSGVFCEFGTDGAGMKIFFENSRFGFQHGDFLTCGRDASATIGSFVLIGVKYRTLTIKTDSYSEIINV